ncbi:TnsA-like heteromeric transposase endonuclease subunit [Mycobacterium haemophilum]|uniref:TnsA-like heteromeric transposase endonuclease subunit n=1 Tax=Mycobacterium haemophilum TaxID=29311 RepID=UPI001E3D2781|nr:TnsA-like heteromeric transposase endonuclease subunit [Mycobacterium haemophilum]
MTVLLSDAADTATAEPDTAEVSWITAEGVPQRLPLDQAAVVTFEDGLPVRRFTTRKSQRHLSGRWWCATTNGHVGFESWLERDHVMLLDFDPAVVGVAAQPFWLSWSDASGSKVRHAPDYFARRGDGSAVVVDCRPIERRRDGDRAKFEATRRVCAQLGWEYRLVGAAEPTLVGNMRWLAGYRHPRHDHRQVAGLLVDVFATPSRLMDGAARVGDPIAVLPVLFHLLWRQTLSADLARPLSEMSVIAVAGARR